MSEINRLKLRILDNDFDWSVLAAFEAAVRAEAWDEGCSHTTDPTSVVRCPDNPYRIARETR